MQWVKKSKYLDAWWN